MEEHLKTIRTIHRTILVLCATVLVFAVSPNDSARYSNALQEIELLHELRKNTDSFGEYLKTAFADHIDQRFATAVKNSGIYQLTGGIRVELDATNADISISSRWYQFHIRELLDTFDSSLENILQYLQNDDPIVVFLPDFKDVTRSVCAAIDENDSVRSWGKKLLSADFVLMAGTTANSASTTTATVTLDVELAEYAGYRRVTLSGAPVTVERTSIPGTGIATWFATDELGKALIRTQDGQSLLFPGLLKVWPDIRTSDFRTARFVLESARDNARQQLAFFGLKVHESVALVAGPVVILLALLYLLAHIKHVDSRSSPSFPWVGLFDDPLSKLLTHTSILVLPLVANASIILRSWNTASPWTWLAIGISLGSIGVGVAVSSEVGGVK